MEFFTEPSERFICVLGDSYMQSYLAGGGIRNGFAAISNKRLYVRGKHYRKVGNKAVSSAEACTIDIGDIMETRNAVHGSLAALGLSLIPAVAILALIIITPLTITELSYGGQVEKVTVNPLAVWFIFMFLVNLVAAAAVYLVKRLDLFEVEYADGCVAFDNRAYSKRESDEFQNQIRLVMERAASGGSQEDEDDKDDKVAAFIEKNAAIAAAAEASGSASGAGSAAGGVGDAAVAGAAGGAMGAGDASFAAGAGGATGNTAVAGAGTGTGAGVATVTGAGTGAGAGGAASNMAATGAGSSAAAAAMGESITVTPYIPEAFEVLETAITPEEPTEAPAAAGQGGVTAPMSEKAAAIMRDYDNLLAQGIISQDDYDQAKADIMGIQ